VSGVSVTCGHTLETRESSRIGRPAKPFLILKVFGPQGAAGHMAALKPSRAGRRVRCRETRGSAGALSSREARSRATGHMTALEPSRVQRKDPEPHDMWQRRSLPSREVGSRAVGHVAAPEASEKQCRRSGSANHQH
jgi:hypothetical protein